MRKRLEREKAEKAEEKHLKTEMKKAESEKGKVASRGKAQTKLVFDGIELPARRKATRNNIDVQCDECIHAKSSCTPPLSECVDKHKLCTYNGGKATHEAWASIASVAPGVCPEITLVPEVRVEATTLKKRSQGGVEIVSEAGPSKKKVKVKSEKQTGEGVKIGDAIRALVKELGLVHQEVRELWMEIGKGKGKAKAKAKAEEINKLMEEDEEEDDE
ncbi:hypothetical protein NMY22_g19961 [Coprinellus aureogranulatus]|nr:hypothetical protein NMY22_g19961 [Coprinellus aureogranulatus]